MANVYKYDNKPENLHLFPVKDLNVWETNTPFVDENDIHYTGVFAYPMYENTDDNGNPLFYVLTTIDGKVVYSESILKNFGIGFILTEWLYYDSANGLCVKFSPKYCKTLYGDEIYSNFDDLTEHSYQDFVTGEFKPNSTDLYNKEFYADKKEIYNDYSSNKISIYRHKTDDVYDNYYSSKCCTIKEETPKPIDNMLIMFDEFKDVEFFDFYKIKTIPSNELIPHKDTDEQQNNTRIENYELFKDTNENSYKNYVLFSNADITKYKQITNAENTKEGDFYNNYSYNESGIVSEISKYNPTEQEDEVQSDYIKKTIEEKLEKKELQTPYEYYQNKQEKDRKEQGSDWYNSAERSEAIDYTNEIFWINSLHNWGIWDYNNKANCIELMLWNGYDGWDKTSDIILRVKQRKYLELAEKYLYTPDIFILGRTLGPIFNNYYYTKYNKDIEKNYFYNKDKIERLVYSDWAQGVLYYETLVLENDTLLSTYDNYSFQNTHNSRVIFPKLYPTTHYDTYNTLYQIPEHRNLWTTQSLPNVLKLKSGELLLCYRFGLFGNVLDTSNLNEDDNNTNKFELSDASYFNKKNGGITNLNNITRQYFGSGSDKTIKYDWKQKFIPKSTEEEIPTEIYDENYDTIEYNNRLYQLDYGDINMKISMFSLAPTIYTDIKKNIEILDRWD